MHGIKLTVSDVAGQRETSILAAFSGATGTREARVLVVILGMYGIKLVVSSAVSPREASISVVVSNMHNILIKQVELSTS